MRRVLEVDGLGDLSNYHAARCAFHREIFRRYHECKRKSLSWLKPLHSVNVVVVRVDAADLCAACAVLAHEKIHVLGTWSIVGVQQIDRVVEVVQETLKGHTMRLLSRAVRPSLDLPKVQITF